MKMAKDNQEVYEALKPFDEISLDCYGYVSAVREEGIEAVLILPNGQELKYTFK